MVSVGPQGSAGQRHFLSRKLPTLQHTPRAGKKSMDLSSVHKMVPKSGDSLGLFFLFVPILDYRESPPMGGKKEANSNQNFDPNGCEWTQDQHERKVYRAAASERFVLILLRQQNH
jgi:hypothetical protein